MRESATRSLYIDLFAFGLEVAYIILVCTCAVPDALHTVGLITPAASSISISGCNSVKSGGPTSNSEHNP